jgi:hypothetical protein
MLSQVRWLDLSRGRTLRVLTDACCAHEISVLFFVDATLVLGSTTDDGLCPAEGRRVRRSRTDGV